MPTEVVMPKLGLNMTEGLLVEWLKKEGDAVKKGDLLFSVETDKITTEAEANVDGVLARIFVQAGETVPVRAVVGVILAAGEELPANYETGTKKAEVKESSVVTASTNAPAPVSTGGPVLASPIAKRLAAENGIDFTTVKGSGAGGRISQEDVERAIQEGAKGSGSKPAEGKEMKIEGVRAVIAERMLKSVQTTAQVTLHAEIDVSAMVAHRIKLKAEAKNATSVPSYNAILAAVCSQALREHPAINAIEEGNTIRPLEKVNVGVAVDTEAGLVVVVVPEADQKNENEVHQMLSTMIERAVARKSMPDDLTGSTFTITNLGGFGVEGFTPIINPPEMAILGVGKIAEKLVIVDGKIAQRWMMTLSLTFDHRLVDGAPAARFLQTIANKLAEL